LNSKSLKQFDLTFPGHWIEGKDRDCYIYVLVNLRHNKSGEIIEYFIVPSRVISEKMVYSESKNSEWRQINLRDVEKYRNDWSVFGKS
jgi:hypothetical protein